MAQSRLDRVVATPHGAIRAVAVFEALKGFIVLLGASGLLALMHKDLYEVGLQLLEHTHLNPAARYPQIFLDALDRLDQPRLLLIAAGALLYSTVRFAESYGLFRERAWAEWLAALGGGIYLPFEVMELVRKPSVLALALLLANVAVVAIMVRALAQRRGWRRS